jgi:hypothetical protein
VGGFLADDAEFAGIGRVAEVLLRDGGWRSVIL